MRALIALVILLSATAAFADEPSGTLVLYTSQTPDVAQQTADGFMKKYPNVKIEWTRNGTTELMNVIHAEIAAGNPRADVLLVADAINLGELKQEGLLQAYPQAPVAGLDKKLYDTDMMIFGTKIISTGIGYNLKNAKKIDSWADLLLSENKGKVSVPSPLYSGAALVHLHTVIHEPSIGWAFYEGLAKNNDVPQGGNGPALNAIADGRALYGVVDDSDAVRAAASGSPIGMIYPKEGVSFTSEPVAIMKSAKNLTAARAFVDFELSQEGQELIVKQGNMPILPSVTPPAGYPKLADIKLLPLDTAQAIATDKDVRARFNEIFGN